MYPNSINSAGQPTVPDAGSSLFSFGMDDRSDLTYHRVKAMLDEHLEANPHLLDSSVGRDIVVFLGNTGAGKSTLINYLSGKELEVDQLGNIVQNSFDPSAMGIGNSDGSETFLPRFVEANDFLFYDLPGFRDTRGTARNLVNACFIKAILENARSARLVFVAGIGEVTEIRGSSFKELYRQATQLIPQKSIETFSALVITKSHVSKDILPKFLEQKLGLAHNGDFPILQAWINRQRIEQLPLPREGDHNLPDGPRESILNLIGDIGRERIEEVDIGVIYDAGQQMAIGEIYETEIGHLADRLLARNGCGLDLLSGLIPQFMGDSPSPNATAQPGELGIFSAGNRLYVKTHNQEQRELARLNGDTPGLLPSSFDRVIRALKDKGNIQAFNLALKQDTPREAITGFHAGIPYESATLADIEALMQLAASCGYVPLNKKTLERKRDYILNEFDPNLSLSLAQSRLIKLLRPISGGIYQSSLETARQELNLYAKNRIALLDGEIARQEKQEEEARRKEAEQGKREEEAKRIQAERQVASVQAVAIAAQQQAASAQQQVSVLQCQVSNLQQQLDNDDDCVIS